VVAHLIVQPTQVAEETAMNKRIARELRNRLAPLSAIAVTFATITVVPAAMAMVAAAGGTGAHQAQATRIHLAALVPADRHLAIGLPSRKFSQQNPLP
jgi:hypothetical protein